MIKRPYFLICYTLFVIVVSSLITTAYFHIFVLNNNVSKAAYQAVKQEKIKNSPINDEKTIIEIFSYACGYCSDIDKNISSLEARMPSGSRLIRLHFSNPNHTGMASLAPLFATLTVMGVEPFYRESIYQAVIKEKLDLTSSAGLALWLQRSGLDAEEFYQVRRSQSVAHMLKYMADVAQHYQINATPTFIVGKKWLVQQDREFPQFSNHLLSLLQHDKPLEP